MASPQEISAAAAAGASMSTHLFNGCPRLIDRHSNVIYSQLSEDALYACFIADGHHVPYPTLRIGLRTKGVGKSILVSDIAHLSGLPDGEYEMEGNAVVLRDGGLRVKGSGLLSGAARTLAQDVELLGRESEPGIEAALLMATVSPAAAVGDRAWAELTRGDADRSPFSPGTGRISSSRSGSPSRGAPTASERTAAIFSSPPGSLSRNFLLREEGMQTVAVTKGVHWVSIPEAGLSILCGCPADSVKLLMKMGLIVGTRKNGVTFETGPNAILLSDVPTQNETFCQPLRVSRSCRCSTGRG